MKKLSTTKLLIFVLIAVILLYLPLRSNFFQQDEWYAFGEMIGNSSIPLYSQIVSFFRLNSGHYVPFHNTIALVLFNLFSLHYQYWALISILWHTINVFLVFILIYRIANSSHIALLTSLLFGISSSTSQATTWIGANISSQGATTFGVLSVYFFWKMFMEKQNSLTLKYAVVSIVFFILSLLFKEITLGLIPLYLVMIWFYKSNKRNTLLMYYSTAGFTYVALRLWTLVSYSSNTESVVTKTQSFTEILYNAITFPLKVLSQTIIPQQVFITTANKLAKYFPESVRSSFSSTNFDLFSQKVVMEGMSLFIFLAIVVLAYSALRQNLKHKLLYVFSFVFFSLNSVIYAFSPERYGRIAIVDSRNLYFPSIGVFLFVVLILNDRIKNRTVQIIIVTILLVANALTVSAVLSQHYDDGKDRKYILSSIHLPDTENKRTIIYTESDTSYFGLPAEQKTLPFQSGFGQTALVYYSDNLNLPQEFYSSHFLWDLTAQGYKEVDSRGFGYYRDFDRLQDAVNTYTIVPSEIHAYRWNSTTKTLVNITDEIREKLVYETNS